jgi:HEXXH motif-containing protein
MVHEFQHSKLNAILDLVAFYDHGDPTTYFAPWRLDPRPIGGLYQGVYAFLGVADVMGRLCGEPELRESAERQFAITREQVRCGLETLLGAPSLTTQGRQFAAGIRRVLHDLYAMDVPQGIHREAVRALDENRSAWRERTGRTA